MSFPTPGYSKARARIMPPSPPFGKVRDDGATSLYTASYNGDAAVVRCLVESGADKDRATDDGVSPLYVASQNGHLDIVRCLVGAGADKYKALDDGTLPVHIASYNGHVAVVKHLLGEAGRCTPPPTAMLDELALKASPELAPWLKSIAGWQPLHFACDADNRPVIVELLRSGASPVAAAGGVTPAMLGSACTRRFVAHASVWSPGSHALFPACVHAAVRTVLQLHAREYGVLPTVHIDVLLFALGFLPREQLSVPSGFFQRSLDSLSRWITQYRVPLP